MNNQGTTTSNPRLFGIEWNDEANNVSDVFGISNEMADNIDDNIEKWALEEGSTPATVLKHIFETYGESPNQAACALYAAQSDVNHAFMKRIVAAAGNDGDFDENDILGTE